jgi:Zn-dependent protease
VIALIFVIPLKYFPNYMGDTLTYFLGTIFEISLVLFAFNMLPFPPLDGSKFIQIFVPKRFAPAYDRYLASAGLYFMAFVIIDNLIFAKYFHFSILNEFMGKIYVFLKALIFLGS